MDDGSFPDPQLGVASGENSMAEPGHIAATGAADVEGPVEESPDSDDFPSVAWSSSDYGPSTRDQAVQTMVAPHMVNEMTQYRDPDDFGSDTDSSASTPSSQRPVIFASIGARRRRLRVSDWLVPARTAAADNTQLIANGHVGERAEGPGTGN